MNEAPPEFKPWPKIPRMFRDMVITEKLDGTNASVLITGDGDIFAGSRTRWITPQNDNYGFAKWVEANKTELLKLGPGHHFGEWWGQGIQRGYGLTEKRFSLFNVHKWGDLGGVRPACVGVVPVLCRYAFNEEKIRETLLLLQGEGSKAAPGFMNPEGIIVFHEHSRQLFKFTLDKDDGHKG